MKYWDFNILQSTQKKLKLVKNYMKMQPGRTTTLNGRQMERRSYSNQRVIPDKAPGKRFSSWMLNDRIYVMGGITSWTNDTDKNEVYDPNTDSWQTFSPLPNPYGNPIIAVIDNGIYALCGDELWMYDTSSDTRSAKENSPAWTSVMFGCAVINDYIIIPGGQNRAEKAVSRVYIYSAASNSWTRSTDLPKPIQLGGIATLGGKIYIIGGCDTDFNTYDTVFEGSLVE